MPGRRIMSARRHGKQLFLPLDRGVLGLHMGMTGRLVILGPDDTPMRYARYTFTLDDGRRIELDDMRRWAGAVLADSEDELTGRLGPDAIDPGVHQRRVRGAGSPAGGPQSSRCSSTSRYWQASATYTPMRHCTGPASRPSAGLTGSRAPDWARLHGDLFTVLNEAIGYITANPDERGAPYVVDAYDERMRLSRKRGAPCPACAEPIRSRKLGGRTAYYCPRCSIERVCNRAVAYLSPAIPMSPWPVQYVILRACEQIPRNRQIETVFKVKFETENRRFRNKITSSERSRRI